MRPPLLYRLYVAASLVLVPFFAWYEIRKLRRAGVPVVRAHEKLGHATAAREGSGPLVWFHGASVGESLSALALISEMGRQVPRAQFLVTSGTATSAAIIGARLPPRTVHQFAPLDAPGPVSRFLEHWRPNGIVFVESELWPQMLRRARDKTGAQMVLVNARLSPASQRAWQRRPRTASYVLSVFDLILTQNDAMAQAMVDLHAPADRVARGINLKALANPLPQDPALLAQVRTSLKGRPVWIAASTHRGEEEIVLTAHRSLLETYPDLLLLLAPRHPDRSAEIVRKIEAQGFSCAVRSKDVLPSHHQVFLADTMGELGSWYALSDAIFLGGSLKPFGGHNPFEVALAGSGVLSGPEVSNFSETYREMQELQAAHIVGNAADLAAAVDSLLSTPSVAEAAGRAAREFLRREDGLLATLAGRVVKALKLEENWG